MTSGTSTSWFTVLAIVGMLAIGGAIAAFPPPHWELCEVVLFGAGFMVVRECNAVRGIESELRHSGELSSARAKK
jgi:hypothetical protein